MIFMHLLYVLYWVVLGVIVWRYEGRITWLEEENRHLKEVADIYEDERARRLKLAVNFGGNMYGIKREKTQKES